MKCETQMPSSPLSHDDINALLNNYMNDNPKIGYLSFDVYQDSPVEGRVPIPNAVITVSQDLGYGYYFANVAATDDSGETEPISLPTLDRSLSLSPGQEKVCSFYNVHIQAPGYNPADFYGIQVFDGITTFQHANLIPVVNEYQ